MELLLDNNTQELIKTWLPKNATISDLSSFFSAFSDVTRTRIVCALSLSEMCVGDLSSVLNLNQTTCSHQLKLLKIANVVEDRREGKVVYYKLKSPKIARVMLAGVECIGL